MPILIKTKSDQTFWINVDGSRFLVRTLTSSQDSAITKKHTKTEKGFPRPDVSEIQDEKFQKMVLGWEGVSDIDGNPVEYSEEIKKVFAEYNPDVAWQIIRKAERHDVEERKVEFKNLGE